MGETVASFKELLAKVVDWLQHSERVSYRAIKRQFDLDDEYLEDLKEAILFAHPEIIDDTGLGFVLTREADPSPEPPSAPAPPKDTPQTRQKVPLDSQLSANYTPDAELRQLTVMFCDLAGSTRLSGQLEPEEYREVVRAYQSACNEAVKSYDGYTAQHLGVGYDAAVGDGDHGAFLETSALLVRRHPGHVHGECVFQG